MEILKNNTGTNMQEQLKDTKTNLPNIVSDQWAAPNIFLSLNLSGVPSVI